MRDFLHRTRINGDLVHDFCCRRYREQGCPSPLPERGESYSSWRERADDRVGDRMRLNGESAAGSHEKAPQRTKERRSGTSKARQRAKPIAPLTAKQQRFVSEYLLSRNASDAARKAGYSSKTAGRIGEENLKKPGIRMAIDEASATVGLSLAQIIAEQRDKLLHVLFDIAYDTAAPASARIAAVKEALDRAYGKSIQPTSDSGDSYAAIAQQIEKAQQRALNRKVTWDHEREMPVYVPDDAPDDGNDDEDELEDDDLVNEEY